MNIFFRGKCLVLATTLFTTLLFSGCDPKVNPSGSNVANSVAINAANTNSTIAIPTAKTNSAASVNSTSPNSSAIDTREPEIYQAVVTLKLETNGTQQTNLPPINAQVARNGADRRMEFALPNGEKVIYLDAAGKHYLISPNRKQFAELNKDSLGFDVRNMMTPTQIVQQVKNLKGVELVGEENLNGRTVVKYKYNGVADTKSQAGNVQTESVFLIDKETGLPLRSETNSNSQNGQVKGISGIKLVTEMSNIQTTVTPKLFVAPKDYKQVAPEEVRGQLTAFMNIAAAVLGNVINNSQTTNNPTPAPAP